jgi:regulator of RNase E activity RraA
MPPGSMVVVDAIGTLDAGVFGDILCARMKIRGVAGMVTDGVVRDVAGVLGTACRCGARARPRRPPSAA